MMLRNILTIFLTFCALTLISGCASKTTSSSAANEDQSFQAAQRSIDKGFYAQAITELELMENQYPFGNYAEQIQINLVFANYKNRNFKDSIVIADRFMRLHPDHGDIAYVWYLKALATFDLSRTNRSFISGKDISSRDPKFALQAFEEFGAYLQNFPDHKYAPDARLRQLDIRNRLARYELQVAQFYQKKRAWVAAANRATTVIENYPGSPYVAEALVILKQAYEEMGQAELAAQIEAAIGQL